MGGCRASSAAFEDDGDGSPMSGYLAGQGTTTTQILIGHEDYAVVGFAMAVARGKNLGVARAPLENDPDHVLIFGNKTYATKKELYQKSIWIVPPPLSCCRAPGGVCTCVAR